MIFEVPWHRLGCVKVWWDEPLPLRVQAGEWLVDRRPCAAAGDQSTRRMMVEAVLNVGPRIKYCLLGAERSVASVSESVIRVPISTLDGPPWAGTEAPTRDDPRAGLTLEYATPVFEGVQRTFDRSRSHELVFSCAMYTEIGSPPSLYGQIAELMGAALSADESEASREERVCDFVIRVLK